MIQQRVIGIMGAMPEEIGSIVQLLSNTTTTVIGQRTYYAGFINNVSTVVVFSRWGKVAAATTVSTLINHFKVTEIIFTGVAGAIATDINIGDVVIGKRLIQHDMDARPLMQQFEIPLLNKTYFESDATLCSIAETSIKTVLQKELLQQIIGKKELLNFNISDPKLVVGNIASGDQFFATHAQKEKVLQLLPTILCVEMEGAAVAQVCYEHAIPFVIIRTISDVANEQSPVDFPLFIKSIASKYAAEIIAHIYEQLV
jgi:adenosylhomocysteine nucleosidase